MDKYFFIVILVFLSSCCGLHTEVKYMFQNATILRIDECGITSFYYKDKSNKTLGKIWAEYSGINDGFSGYLKFDKNNKVTILSGDGYFQSLNNDATYFAYEYVYSYNRPQISTSVCCINSTIKVEKEKNLKTGVKIEYKIDDNEW